MKRKYALIIALGFQLPAYIFAGLIVGYFFEKKFPFHGLILTAGAFLGVFTWLFQMVKWLKKGDGENGQSSRR